MVESERIPVPITGMSTKNGRERIGVAIEERNKCDHECFAILKAILEKKLAIGKTHPLIRRGEKIIDRRMKWDDELTRAAAGQPKGPYMEELEGE